jgi:formylglycine-generating enzyme required for sulfatase activity
MPAEPLQFDNYVVPIRADGTLWELGHGAMGITYKAFDTRLRVDVVLKVIKHELLTSERARFLFLREARAAAKVRHPNIAAVITLHDSEPFYYTMEFVAGHTLAELLKSRGPFSPGEALDYADQIAAALGAMAREHIVHRDLKPSNIMVVPDDDRPFGNLLKVIDFGLAKGFRADDVDPETHLRSLTNWSSGFTGTVAYASPEQCAELPEIDGRSDLYSLGIILWQMLTGKLPFSGTLGQISAMQQSKEPPWDQLGATPEPIIDLLHQLLAKQPDDRFAGARELREAMANMHLSGNDRRRRDRAAVENPGVAAGVETQADAPAPETVRLGTTLAERYTVGELVADGDGGKLFKAADNQAGGTLVAMKLLDPRRTVDDGFCGRVRDELDALKRTPQAVVLAPITGLLRSGHSTFYVREWADGFSLEELVVERHGHLHAREVWRLLQALPAALDQAAAENLTLAEPLLRKLFVCPPPGAMEDRDWPALRSRPIEEWPDFRLRWNALSFRPVDGQVTDSATQIQGAGVSATEDRVRALALLVRELLGGRAGTLTPLPALGDEANAILQRALVVGGGTTAFKSAGDFWNALATFSSSKAVPRSSPAATPAAPAHPAARGGTPSRRAPIRRSYLVGLLMLALIGSGLAWFIGVVDRKFKKLEQARQVQVTNDSEIAAREAAAREQQERDRLAHEKELQDQLEKEKAARVAAEQRADEERKASAERAVPASTPAPAPAASENPLATRAKPFVNSLGMKFVPVPGVNVLFCIWKTRVADFQAFCERAPYTQEGGVSTRQVVNGKGEHKWIWTLDAKASWKEPGFPQAPDHPVVGVNWNEAKAFCRWLTIADREAGRIAADEYYRLPTDAEWSAAVGTAKYPWGNQWPPPKGAGNYLDSTGVAELPGSGWTQVPGNDGYAFTSPVGSFRANAHGLYDLGGNAWEWCEDEYKAEMNDEEAKQSFPNLWKEKDDDGTTPLRILRGAAWGNYYTVSIRSAFRYCEPARYRVANNGFRVVLVHGPR